MFEDFDKSPKGTPCQKKEKILPDGSKIVVRRLDDGKGRHQSYELYVDIFNNYDAEAKFTVYAYGEEEAIARAKILIASMSTALSESLGEL